MADLEIHNENTDTSLPPRIITRVILPWKPAGLSLIPADPDVRGSSRDKKLQQNPPLTVSSSLLASLRVGYPPILTKFVKGTSRNYVAVYLISLRKTRVSRDVAAGKLVREVLCTS